MGIDTLYSSKIEENIQRWVANPGPAPGPASFNAWSFLAAGAKGPVAGALESAGSSSDLLSLFAAPAAATFGAMDTSGAVDQAGVEAARQKVLSSQAFDPTAGDILRRKADTFMPDPETSTRADQTIAGLTRGVTKAAADITTLGPAAGAVAFGLDEGNTAGQRLRMEGVDTGTAFKVGAVTAVTSGAGAVIPMGGATLLKTAGLAAVAGPGTFVAQEALSKKILAEAGYNDQASLHDPLDPLGLTLSTVIPFGFGAMHLRGVAKRVDAVSAGKVPLEQMSSSERIGLKYDSPELDAYAVKAAEANGVPPAVLLAVKNAGEKSGSTQVSPKGAQGVMQFMPATAKEIGITDPRDPMQSITGGAVYLRKLYDAYGSWDAAVAHYNGGGSQAALVRGGVKPSFPETAKYLERVQQYMQDHAVKTGAADPDVVDAARVKVTNEALNRSLPSHPQALSEVLQASDYIAAGRMPEVASLTGRQQIQTRFSDQLADHEVAVRDYANRPDSEGGKVLNTDVARELSPDYLKDRTQSAAVHEPASAFVKRLYAEKLADIKPGEQVMFTSGGTGAGKTSAISGVDAIARMKRNSAIVYDTNMNTLGSAVSKIDQALNAGADVRIVHVQRDPVEALVHGALPRAMRQEAEFGTGRTVPLAEHARTHRGAAEVIQQLAEKYKDNPRVDIQVIDNTRGKGGQQVADLGFVRDFDYNGLEGRLHEALKQQYESGAISGSVRRGTEGDAGTGVRPAVRAADGPEPAGKNGREASLPDARKVGIPPEKIGDVALSIDTQRVASIVEADPGMRVKLPGSDETLTVGEAFERAKAEAKEEAGYSKLVDAAVKCFLSFGA